MQPEIILAVAVAFLGAILGSFLNALLYRYNTGISVVRGRSKCMRCGHTLHATDLLPILSYIFLQGKCRYCRSHIALQYPLVELAAAALALLLFVQHPAPLEFAYSFLVWLTLLFIFVYDLRHQVIPWSANGLLVLLAIGGLVAFHASPTDWLAGPLLALPLFLLSLVSGGKWMGWGDAPLQLGLGWFLGLWAGLTGLVLAFWAGALVGIVLMLCSSRYTMRSEVPFAPFLIFGAWCAYFLHVDLFSNIPALFF